MLWCREAVCSWGLTKLGGIETGFPVRLMKKTVVAVVTCSLALGNYSSFGLGTSVFSTLFFFPLVRSCSFGIFSCCKSLFRLVIFLLLLHF